jgi:AcrR family transcriptional regulator
MKYSYDRMKSPEATRSRLLRTAQRLFAERGYAGTSVRQITAQARANLGAITYHFGSKERLHHAVLTGLFTPLAERISAEADAGSAPLAALERIVIIYFEYFREHPDLPRLMLQELSQAGPFPPELARQQRRVREAIVTLISRGQADGSVRPGMPMLMALGVVAQPVFLAVARRAMTHVAGLDAADPAVMAQAARHAAQFVRQGLAATPEGSAHP